MSKKRINTQRLERIAATPGRATMDDVTALVVEVEHLHQELDEATNRITNLE